MNGEWCLSLCYISNLVGDDSVELVVSGLVFLSVSMYASAFIADYGSKLVLVCK